MFFFRFFQAAYRNCSKVFDKKETHDLTCLSHCDATGSAPDLLITTVRTEVNV